MASSTLVIGISGPSSSGKTSLAHLLLHVLSPRRVQLLHADDFCREFEEIPRHASGYLDCEGPAAVDTGRLAAVLDYTMQHEKGALPSDFQSWQDDVFPGAAEKALTTVPEDTISRLKDMVSKSGVSSASQQIVIVDGFLLYHNQEIRDRLQVKLFLRLSHDIAKERRFSRPGYGDEAKGEEFWKTEDYFEKMVWPSYVQQHAMLFENSNVEGPVNQEKCQRLGIAVTPIIDASMRENLEWAVENVILELESAN